MWEAAATARKESKSFNQIFRLCLRCGSLLIIIWKYFILMPLSCSIIIYTTTTRTRTHSRWWRISGSLASMKNALWRANIDDAPSLRCWQMVIFCLLLHSIVMRKTWPKQRGETFPIIIIIITFTFNPEAMIPKMQLLQCRADRGEAIEVNAEN